MSKEVEKADLEEIILLARQIARLQARYLRNGFTVEEIASTFADIYYREFNKEIDQKILNLIALDVHPEMRVKCKVEKAAAMGNICIRFSGAFIDVISQKMHEDDKKEELRKEKQAQRDGEG